MENKRTMEIWKEVLNSSDYEVSNMGRIRNKKTRHILSVKPTKSHKNPQVFLGGYYMRKQLTASHLVYDAFLLKPYEKPLYQSMYWDGVKGNRIGYKDGNVNNIKAENLYRY